MIDRGLPVALATDMNPGSCYSESIPLLISLATLYMNLTIEETITSLTLNGAAAVGQASRIGSIEPGKQADMVVIDAPDYRHLSYHIGVNSVTRVIKRGDTIWQKSAPEF
jgi:imidazolonepropionase